MDTTTFSRHISRQFNTELEELLQLVMQMGGLVERQLADAVTALTCGDIELAELVTLRDEAINALEIAVDDESTRILARRQPTASDLRLIMAVIRTVSDLERMGDEAERVGKMAIHLLPSDRLAAPMREIAMLGEHVREMLRKSLNAFARMNAGAAVEAARMDYEADRQYEAILRALLARMSENADAIPRLVDVIWSVRSLERIGDRSRNICEHVIYCVKGRDVRHTDFEGIAEQEEIPESDSH